MYNETKDIKWKAYQLYMKYVKTGGKYEINISYQSRLYLTQLMYDYDLWIKNDISTDDLCELFKSSKDQMLKLIRYSFNRFRNTDEWIKILKVLG